ncbi:hypothetical protein EDC01DRAFT_59397 [Geopyxis carbonaria]|nr:hypothetical protein EDC01DRAFT_59397 [Geopyxis carbonaria]
MYLLYPFCQNCRRDVHAISTSGSTNAGHPAIPRGPVVPSNLQPAQPRPRQITPFPLAGSLVTACRRHTPYRAAPTGDAKLRLPPSSAGCCSCACVRIGGLHRLAREIAVRTLICRDLRLMCSECSGGATAVEMAVFRVATVDCLACAGAATVHALLYGRPISIAARQRGRHIEARGETSRLRSRQRITASDATAGDRDCAPTQGKVGSDRTSNLAHVCTVVKRGVRCARFGFILSISMLQLFQTVLSQSLNDQ